MRWLAAAFTIVVLVVFLLAGAVAGLVAAVFGSDDDTNCVPLGLGPAGIAVAGYGAEQLGHAATIVSVGKQHGVPERGWIVAIAAAMQESGLRNLNHGDRDSLGLFQQRPSQGWGTPEQVRTPTYAAKRFYQHLLEIPGWRRMSINDAAQAVQRSGHPTKYADDEHAARQVVAALHGATCTTTSDSDSPAPTQAAAEAIAFARKQIGQPYVWGGDGPHEGGFDCSGLTTAAYAKAGIQLPRTAHTQYHATSRVPQRELRPGDLVFYGNPGAKIHHVGLYIGNGQMIDAPTFGQPVGIHPIRYPGDDFAGGGRIH